VGRTSLHGRGVGLAALCLSALLAGCSEPTGDFGRRADNTLTNSILPNSGWFAAKWRYEPVSPYALTDDEEELRDRAYRLVGPGHDRAWLNQALTELRYTRVLPFEVNRDPALYHTALVAVPVRSVASRYERLQEDIEGDRLSIGPFLAAAKRVIGQDVLREKAIAAAHDVDTQQRLDAQARIAENRALILWTCDSIVVRVKRYRYAFEHLVIEGPQQEMLQAERSLVALENDPRSLCRETVPLIDPPPRASQRGLDRPAVYPVIPQRQVPIDPGPVRPPLDRSGPQGQPPLVRKG